MYVRKKYGPLRSYLMVLLLAILTLQCNCKKAFWRSVGLENKNEEEGKRYQEEAKAKIADIKARSEAFSAWLKEMSRLDAINKKEEEVASQKSMEALRQLVQDIKKQYSVPLKYNFAPTVRSRNVARMQEYVTLFKRLLSKEPSNIGLSSN